MVGILKRYYKLIVVMIFLISAIFYGQFRYSSGLLKELGEERIKDNFTILKTQVDYWVSDKEKIIEDSITVTSNHNNNKEQILNFLKNKLRTNPELENMYYLSRNNEIISVNPIEYSDDNDYRESSWYVQALEKNRVFFSEAFLNEEENDLLIRVSGPVRDSQNVFLGVVAGDLKLSELSSILKESNTINDSKGLLIGPEGSLIIDSSLLYNSQESFKEYLNIPFEEKVIFRGQSGNFKSEELGSNGLKILMFVPTEFISKPVNTLRGNFIITLSIFFTMMFVFAFLQRRVVTGPLEEYDLNAKRKMQTERETFEALFKNSSDAIVIVDSKNKVIEVNEKFEELFKYKLEEIKGGDIDLFIVPEEKISEAKDYTNLLFREEINSVETIRHDKFKNLKDVELKGTPIFLDGKVIGRYVSYTDISARKAFEKKILFMSYHDQLTGIYNRRYFEENIKEMDNINNYPLTMIMGDLNGLKLANDAFGHSFGDKLLIKTAEILVKFLEGKEFAARIGGDEFIIVIPNKDEEEIRKFINKISKEIEETRIGSIDLSVSFGWDTKYSEDQNIIEVLNKAESFMYKRKLSESPSMISNTIKVIISTLYEKNQREKSHSERVGELCFLIGKKMKFDQEKLSELRLVGLMHDIGKIGIDENILNKEGKLTNIEYNEIKKHPEIGYRILNSANQMSDIAEYTLAHHERWDGKGYPNGIMGEAIPLVSRIISVADSFDAMTSYRTYKEPVTEKEACEELRKHAGSQFDPQIVKIFTEKVLKY